jgi:hypothetical protein
MASAGLDNGNEAAAPDHDFDNDSRPQETGVDRGADEVVVPPPVLLYFSTSGSFDVVGDGQGDDADIYSWNGVGFARVFDGSAAGLPGSADIDALVVADAATFYVSFIADTAVPGVGTVQDVDVVRYDVGTGTWSLFFDGSDVALSAGVEDVDAFDILEDGSIVISTVNTGNVPGVGYFNDEDLVRCGDATFGPATSCTWSLYFDGSDVGLTTGAEDVDGVAVSSTGILLSTTGNFNVGVSGQGADVFACVGATLGSATACTGFVVLFDGSVEGVTQNLDAIGAGPGIEAILSGATPTPVCGLIGIEGLAAWGVVALMRRRRRHA